MRRLGMVAMTLALMALGACTPSPEEVCAHADKLANEGKARRIDNCERRMQMKKDTRPKEYRELAPCIMKASSVDGVNGCLSTHQAE